MANRVNFFYCICTLIILSSCTSNNSYKGVYYNSNDMKVSKVIISKSGDSLFLFDTKNYNENYSQNNIYLRGLIENNNKINGLFNNGKTFIGSIIENENGIKIVSSDSSFTCEAFSDTIKSANLYNEFNEKRKKEFDNVLPMKRYEIINNLLPTFEPVISVHNSIDQGFSKLPEGTKFYIITDFSSCTFPIIKEQVSDFQNESVLINKKTPFVVRVSKRDISYSGNRFSDGGLSRGAIGEAYDYGNYSGSIKRKEVQIYFYNIENNSIDETNFGYVIDGDNEPPKAYSFYAQVEIYTKPWIDFFQLIEKNISKQ